MKDRYVYVAVLTYEENGIAIEFPDLPGCYPCAEKDDIEGALQNAKEALGLHIWGMEQDGRTSISNKHYRTFFGKRPDSCFDRCIYTTGERENQ